MENLMEIVKTDVFLLIMLGIMIFLLIGFIIILVRFSSLNRKYNNFMKKLGSSDSLEEDL